MDVALHEVKGHLSEYIRRVNDGEHIVITSHGKPVAELRAVGSTKHPIQRLAAMHRIMREAAVTITEGPDAAHSADFLYDDEGMP